MCYSFHNKLHLLPASIGPVMMLVLLLLTRVTLAGDSAFVTDTLKHRGVKKYDFSLSMSLGGSLGSYDNLTGQTGDPPTPLGISSSAYLLYGELGIGFQSLGVSYYIHAVASPIATFIDDDGFNQFAERLRHGTKVTYEISYKSLSFVPEGGYVFLREKAAISDSRGERPDPYLEKCKDQDYSYGLSMGRKLMHIGEPELWLYGRYVHDNLDIRADNYWLGLHLPIVVCEGPSSKKWKPYMQAFCIRLGVSWTKRTDGRSDWFLRLSFAMEYGLF